MTPYILLVGEIPAQDKTHIAAAAADQGFSIKQSPMLLEGLCTPTECAGIIVCNNCTPESLADARHTLPTEKSMPLFWRLPSGDIPSWANASLVCGFIEFPLTPQQTHMIFSTVIRHIDYSREQTEQVLRIDKFKKERRHLVKIGIALTSHNNLNALLSMILTEIRDMVNADAGSIYIREKSRGATDFNNMLNFAVSQNDSLQDIGQKSREVPIPMNHQSIAGSVATTGETLVIDDIYELDDSTSFKLNRKQYEKKFNYRVKSMLTVPMKNLTGEVVGVFQLMNKKMERALILSSTDLIDKSVIPFSQSDVDSVMSIAAQTAVTIERAQLYDNIEMLLEGFLDSSSAAIDERDRVTSGHSRRVSGYSMAFVDAINAQTSGPFADIAFSQERKRQLKFAALLHDIGKIGVPEALLTKETKLSTDRLECIRIRVEYISLAIAKPDSKKPLPWNSLSDLDADFAFIKKVNTAGFLPDADQLRLAQLRQKRYFDMKGIESPFITDDEWQMLSIRTGNLSEDERKTINSHSISTRRILSKIPWTRELSQIPEIACHHHEKLDGSGYPDGLRGSEISLESRILSVVDIYEALVAQDRPYKPAVAPEKAIEILKLEADANHLDPAIIDLFVSSGIHKLFIAELPASNVEL